MIERLRRLQGKRRRKYEGRPRELIIIEEPAEPLEIVGRERKVLLSEYIKAEESQEPRCPKVRSTEAEHRFATVDDVYGSGHLPDSIAAMALAWRAGEQDSGVTVR